MNMGRRPERAAETRTGAGKFGLLWALKRALLGTAILVVSIGGLAWLTHAAIDPSLEEPEGLLSSIGRAVSNF